MSWRRGKGGVTPLSKSSFSDTRTPPQYSDDQIVGYKGITETFGKNHKYGSPSTDGRPNTAFTNPSETDIEDSPPDIYAHRPELREMSYKTNTNNRKY